MMCIFQVNQNGGVLWLIPVYFENAPKKVMKRLDYPALNKKKWLSKIKNLIGFTCDKLASLENVEKPRVSEWMNPYVSRMT